MAEFKVGDFVEFVENYNSWAKIGHQGHIISVSAGGISGYTYGVEGVSQKAYGSRLKLIKENKVMSSIIDKVKELALSKEDRLLRKHGIVEDCGQLTNDGRALLETILFDTHKAAIVKAVQEVDDEEKATKKK